MISKPQARKIVRGAVGLCLAAGLIYFLFDKNSPRIVGGLITLAGIFFFILSRRAGVYDSSPYFRRLAMVGSRKPFRDLAMAVACFAATMAFTIAIAIGVKSRILPDNYVTAGFLVIVLIVGILGVFFFISGVIGRVLYGPPPP